MKWLMGASALLAAPAAAQTTPLFASDEPIRLTISGPINALARTAEKSVEPRDGVLKVAGSPEAYAIKLSPRGITRRKKDTCGFPPLRVEFPQKPAASSLFAGQRRLKLVTHCRSPEGFQQHLLLEYSAYRIFNLISPASFRARLASIDYVEADGKPIASRWGFFIEDLDDAARRNGMAQARVGDRVAATQLQAKQAARVALFQYMIGNLDWSMRAGPAGEGCCHNGRLIVAPGSTALVPVPYDFDYSGLVDAPYAVPPENFKVDSVRERSYQGYCRLNGEAVAAAAEFRALRPSIEGLFGQIPGMTDKSRNRARAFLAEFYSDIATNESLQAKVLKKCV
jgi:hypothetical protein